MTSSEGVAQERVCPRCGSENREIRCYVDLGYQKVQCDGRWHTAPPIEGQQEESRVWTMEMEYDWREWKRLAEKHWADFKEAEATLSTEHSKRLEQRDRFDDEVERLGVIKEEYRIERDEAVKALRGDYQDVLAIVDVNTRSVVKQGARIRKDAEGVRKWADSDKGGRATALHTLADRLEKAADQINHLLDKPALTQYRQDLAKREQRRHYQQKLLERAEFAEAQVARLREALERIDRHEETCTAGLSGPQPCLTAVILVAHSALTEESS